nr:MAG TPA: hypothetical protein [Caudoviricetes sp.]
MCDYIGFRYLCTFAARKTSLQPFSYKVVGARTLYIRKTAKTLLFAVCSRFLA